MLKIGEFSKLSRISIRMLRHYDEIGLLTPGHIDAFSGYRYYSEEQLITAGRIAALKDMGFGLAAISEVLKQADNGAALDRFLALKEAELRELLQETERRLRLLSTARNRLRKDETIMKYDVTLKTLPDRQVASVRMTLPNYQQEGMLWRIMNEETAALNLQPTSPCYCSVIYHDGEYKEADVDVEAQKTIRGEYPDTPHVKFKSMPAVTFASATFKGPYDLIPEVNVAVASWVRDNGYEYAGPAFYIYHVTPNDTLNPEEYVT